MPLPVSAITVAFGKPEVLRVWVQKWTASGATCIIVDNGGSVPDDIKKKVLVLPFIGNTGFGAGINRGVLRADTPVVLVTNPDTVPWRGEALENLLAYHKAGRLTGALTTDVSGREIHSTGIWPHRSWVRMQIFRTAETLWREDRVDWVQGSLIMLHREDFTKTGGFNSRYPLYFEDVDMCARAATHGITADFCRESRFVHDEGTGSNRVAATRIASFHWGLLQFFRDHDPENAGAVKKMIAVKSVVRMLAFFPTNRSVFTGYYRTLRSVLSGIAPVLPETSVRD